MGEEEAKAVLDIIRRNSNAAGSGSDIYSSKYRHDIDNDSSTDEEPMDDVASSDEEDFISKYGKISTQTSSRGKVRINKDRPGRVEHREQGDVDSEDDFEADMKQELEARVQAAEQNAALTSSTLQQDEEVNDEDIGDLPDGGGKGREGREAKEPAIKDGKYSDIYFDSDEEEDDRRTVKTNDELLYDPNKDDEDQLWIDDIRRSYQLPGKVPIIPGEHQKLPSSDAVLNCPACFTVICLDCQRHDVYKTQYRAMFVTNCSVVTDQKLKFPVAKRGKKGKRNRGPVLDPNEEFHPVKCDQCKTEVAMYDTEEVYHFFNVVASHT